MTKEVYEKYSNIQVQFLTLEKLRHYITTVHDIRKEYNELEAVLNTVEKKLCEIYNHKEADLTEQLNKI